MHQKNIMFVFFIKFITARFRKTINHIVCFTMFLAGILVEIVVDLIINKDINAVSPADDFNLKFISQQIIYVSPWRATL